MEGVAGWFVLLPCFINIPILNENSADPDRTPRSAASVLGLHGLPMSLLWDTGLKRVKLVYRIAILPLILMQLKITNMFSARVMSSTSLKKLPWC